MALLYATYIIRGKWKFKDVASPWVEEVRTLLIAEGREDLINES